MKILKRPDNIIFDTENPDNMVFNPAPKALPHPLGELIGKSEWDFLEEHFKGKEHSMHPIFNRFGTSYYYCIEV